MIDIKPLLKPSVIRNQILLTSIKKRVGKFHRVHRTFVTQIERDVHDYLVKTFESDIVKSDPDRMDPAGIMITKKMRELIAEAVNRRIALIIQKRIASHPSIGSTLKGI